MIDYFKISKFFLYLIPFSILIVSTSTFFPFIVGKYVFFRGVVSLALIFYLLGLLFQFKEVRPPKINDQSWGGRTSQILKSPLVIAVSIFVFIFILAGFFGVDPAYSFWSNFERGEGGLQMIYFFTFFILLVLLFQDEKSWHWLFMVSLGAAGLMIIYGLMAAFKIVGFMGPGLCDRFQGSLGNPAYVGTYLIFSLFYTGYLLTNLKENLKKGFLIGLSGLLIFFFFFLLLSQTRGAFMGLGIGAIVFSFYLAKTLPSGWLKKTAFFFGFFLIILAVSVVWFKPKLNPVPFCPSAGRLLAISLYDSSSQPRLWTWGSAIKGFKERPLFGWGPENFAVVFDKYLDTRHYNPNGGSQTWFDRAHSIYFDYLNASGILGFLSYLAIFGVFYWQFIRTRTNADYTRINADKNKARNYADQNTDKNQLITNYQLLITNALLFALPVAYLVQGIVLFEVLPIYINLFLFLAFTTYKFKIQNSKF